MLSTCDEWLVLCRTTIHGRISYNYKDISEKMYMHKFIISSSIFKIQQNLCKEHMFQLFLVHWLNTDIFHSSSGQVNNESNIMEKNSRHVPIQIRLMKITSQEKELRQDGGSVLCTHTHTHTGIGREKKHENPITCLD